MIVPCLSTLRDGRGDAGTAREGGRRKCKARNARRHTVVAPTAETVVESLPEGGEEVRIGEITYVKVGETYYQPIQQDGKEMWFIRELRGWPGGAGGLVIPAWRQFLRVADSFRNDDFATRHPPSHRLLEVDRSWAIR